MGLRGALSRSGRTTSTGRRRAAALAVLSVFALLALGAVPIGGSTVAAHRAAASAPQYVIGVRQSPAWITEQSTMTVAVQVLDPANVSLAYFTFCQITNSLCYLPRAMTLNATGWFVGTTLPMTQYAEMKVGISAGYNITVEYKNGTNVTAPSVPNPFPNLILVQSVTGENLYQMTVRNQVYVLTGTVTNASGAPLAGATVSLSPSNDSPATTNASGAYSFAAVPNGTYTVSVSMTGFPTQNESVQVQGSNAQARAVVLGTASSGKGPGGGSGSGTSGGGGSSLSGTDIALVGVLVVVLVGAPIAFVLARRRRGGPGGR